VRWKAGTTLGTGSVRTGRPTPRIEGLSPTWSGNTSGCEVHQRAAPDRSHRRATRRPRRALATPDNSDTGAIKELHGIVDTDARPPTGNRPWRPRAVPPCGLVPGRSVTRERPGCRWAAQRRHRLPGAWAIDREPDRLEPGPSRRAGRLPSRPAGRCCDLGARPRLGAVDRAHPTTVLSAHQSSAGGQRTPRDPRGPADHRNAAS
jgi:hypothetical protein